MVEEEIQVWFCLLGVPFASPPLQGIHFSTGQLTACLQLAVLSVTNHGDPNCFLLVYDPGDLHFKC